MQLHEPRSTLAWFGDAVAGVTPASPEAARALLPDMARYKVLRLVGAGGMGQVYQALDTVLERHVALKVMRTDVPVGERRRFRREALLGARLLHPGLVRVYDMGMMGGDKPADPGDDREREAGWMAMEYLPGTDLLRLLEGARAKGHGLPWAALLRVFVQVLGALQYCHDCRVVHRDVKPANMFVTRDPNTRFLTTKLLDLGIAHDLDGPGQVGRVEVLCGDPNYMAPEQTRANTQIDPRADIYAMGMSLYELTTGVLPFESLLDAPLATLLTAQREAEPEPPSHWLPASTPPELAARVDQLFARACAKRPEARFQTAKEMLAALQTPLDQDLD